MRQPNRRTAADTAGLAIPAPEGVRDRLLDVVDDLFYTRGIRNVGIDEIIARAGVAKASLYKHFPSKDALVAAYVRRRAARWGEWFRGEVERRGGAPRERLLTVFDVLAEWIASSGFRGCAFQNAAVELADRTHEAHAAVIENKRGVHAYLRSLAQDAELHAPDALASQLAVLVEGAIVAAHVGGTPSPVVAARSAAATLVAGAARAPDSPRHARPRTRAG
jgi:AcrR family transcriptional regulator